MRIHARSLIAAPIVALFPWGAGASPKVQATAHVRLVPMGRFPAALVSVVERALRAELGVTVERAAARPLPRHAYYPPRRRFRAERLLDYLVDLAGAAPEATKVLGLTAVDISTTKGRHADWGVFGLGELGGRAAVVSTYPLPRVSDFEPSPPCVAT